MQTLIGKTEEELTALLTGLGAPAYRGKQLFNALYGRCARTFDAITDLPRALKATLEEQYALVPCAVRSFLEAPDGTVKYLVDLADGEVVEAVFLPYAGRTSVCISSQVGCPMACSFCATGTEGLARNLTAGEIVDQVLLVQARHPETRISHVVLMGMGEPMLNLPAVFNGAPTAPPRPGAVVPQPHRIDGRGRAADGEAGRRRPADHARGLAARAHGRSALRARAAQRQVFRRAAHGSVPGVRRADPKAHHVRVRPDGGRQRHRGGRPRAPGGSCAASRSAP